jgi:hypothetical protein
MSKFNPDHKVFLDEMLLNNPMVRSGHMFGYPAYYVGKKMAICHFENGVGVKLPAEKAQHLLAHDPNVTPFQPLGRPPMREWVQINLTDSDQLLQYQTVFEDSIQYILSIQ